MTADRECQSMPESIQIRRETQKSLRHTTMFTYSHANTPRGQSEGAYYLNNNDNNNLIFILRKIHVNMMKCAS